MYRCRSSDWRSITNSGPVYKIVCALPHPARCRQTTDKSVPYMYCSLAVMAAELGRVDEARAWFEEGTGSRFGRTSCALWHAWAVMESKQGAPRSVRYGCLRVMTLSK